MQLFKIRPLEWRYIKYCDILKFHLWKSSPSVNGEYYMVSGDGDRWSCVRCLKGGGYSESSGKAHSLAHGKQLAEADWLARISPALEEVPEADFGNLRLPESRCLRLAEVEGDDSPSAGTLDSLAATVAKSATSQPEPDRELLDAAKELRDWYLDYVGMPAVRINAAIASAERRLKV